VIVRKGLLLAVVASMTVPALPSPSWAQGRSREEQLRRNEIRIMEGVLVQAVRLGAEVVSAELERFEPAGVTVLQGVPRARGFVLDGYGVFFDVEIPDMNQSVLWSIQSVQRDRQFGNALDSLSAALEAIPDGPNRQRAKMALQQVTKTVGGSASPQSSQEQAVPASAQGQVSAASTPMPDPDRLYSDAVKSALLEVMLNHSLQMNLPAEEWLTVAARATDVQMPSPNLSDSITIVLRVRGSDLAIYHAEPARRDEIRQKVKAEARVF
jgi:hypothetical protein